MRKRVFSLLWIVGLAIALAGCGGTTSPDGDDGDTDSADGDSGTTTETSDGGAQRVRIGSFDADGTFVGGVIAASRDEIEAGESSTLELALVDADGVPLTDATDVVFSSACLSARLADIDPAQTATEGGRASATYTANGCDEDDTVTATAIVDDTTLRAEATLRTQPAPPGSITFENAAAPSIGLIGAGGTLPEQSELTFRVTNTAGGPAPNQPVDFDLNTSVGGIALSNAQGTTDANGRVSTTVTAGRVATAVRVTATTTAADTGQSLATQSNTLAITTGLPDNDSFTIGASEPNIEGWDRDNTTTTVTVLLADRFNNPVPDGTAVAFTAEGGAIDGSCTTENGQCSVMFRSQNPRPADGRVTILATAIGEESFTDSNGNGRYDPARNNGERGEPFVDLPEAYRDDNENGARETSEPFLDFNDDGAYTAADGRFSGLRCDDTDCDIDSVNVRGQLVLVLSGSSLNINVRPAVIDLSSGPQDIAVTIRDARGQLAPANTMIEAMATQGTLIGPSSFTQAPANTDPASGSRDGTYNLRIAPADEAGRGSLMITATTPEGVISRGRASIEQ